MHERLPATVESVALTRHAVRRFAADLEVDVDGMVLAVSEAVANVVAHAYPDGAPGDVDVSAVTSPDELIVVVRDDGCGLEGGRSEGGAGFGLSIIRRLAQHVELQDTPAGVALTMRFRRGGVWAGL